ncbi:MAG: methyltransferase [Myxococcota bacterium]|nr:methyltransferase [Myxococcota bacterium]
MNPAPSPELPPMPPAWAVRVLQALRNAVGRLHRLLTPPPVAILEGLTGITVNKAVGIAAELDLAEHLADGPKDLPALARVTATHADSLQRVMRALVGLGFFRVDRAGRYANNGTSELLRDGHPQSMRDFVLFFSSPWVWELFSHGRHAVRTGESGVVAGHGVPFFEHLERQPELGERFDRAMAGSSRANAAVMAERLDFSRFRRVCDVGGGTATNLVEVLLANPHLEGLLFDTPAVAERAAKVLEDRGLGERARAVGGDFFASVPRACDLYMFQAVLHDWNDEECVRILGRVREAAPQGRVLVLESIRPEHAGYDFTKLVDVWMLMATGSGRERSTREFEELFVRAGYRLVGRSVLPTLFHAMELEPA